MTNRGVLDVLPVMAEMSRLELALAGLYRACGEKFAEDRGFWYAIQLQEEHHARVLEGLSVLIASRPDQFRVGRAFNATAIKAVISNVERHTDQVLGGKLPKDRALFIARDFEKSLLEASYCEIVSTDNLEYRKGMEELTRDTEEHRKLFAAEVAKGKRDA